MNRNKSSPSLPVLEVTLSILGRVFWSTCGQFIMTPSSGTNPTCSTQVQQQERQRGNIQLFEVHLTTPPFHPSPDRFLDPQGHRVTPTCFLPFGAGPRVCVGESLARLELFLFLSSLLQRMSFRLPNGDPPPNLQGRLGVVLQPLPFNVVVTPRGGSDMGIHGQTEQKNI